MKLLAKQLLKIAADIEEGFEEDFDLAARPAKPRTDLNASERQLLKEAAKETAMHLGDTTSIVEKSIEYMREGYGDEYYDYPTLVAFYQNLDEAFSFESLRELGLADAVEKLEAAVNDVIPFAEDETEDTLVVAAEIFVVSAFAKACKAFLKQSVADVTDEAWEVFPTAIENLADAFFTNETIDLKKMVGIAFDEGYQKVYSRILPLVEVEWKKFYNDSGEMSGSVLKYLYDIGSGAKAYGKSLGALRVALKKNLSWLWHTASKTL